MSVMLSNYITCGTDYFHFEHLKIMVANMENVALLGKFDIVFDNRSIALFQRSSGCT